MTLPVADRDSRPVGTRTPLRVASAQAAPSWWRLQWQAIRRPRVEAGWFTMGGPGHPNNQDAVLAAAPLYAVADGVGGGSAGELASSQMLAWCQSIPPGAWRERVSLQSWLMRADEALATSLRALNPSGLSATTFVAAWITPAGSGHIAHVGDPRILRIRSGPDAWQTERLTVDQTYANVGEEPPPGGSTDDPARMVGIGAMGEPSVAPVMLREGELLLLCSDGVHKFLAEPEIAGMCQDAQARGLGLTALAEELVHAARAAGSRDDISALVVRRNPLAGARRFYWAAVAVSVAVAFLAWRVAPALF